MPQSERTEVYGEISRDSYGDLLEEKGGIENTRTEDLLKVHQWLTNKLCITKGEIAQATRVARIHFNKRRKHLLAELSLLNDALGIHLGIQEAPQRPLQPQQTSGDGKSLEQKVETPVTAVGSLDEGKIYFDERVAKRMLQQFFQDDLIVPKMYSVLRRDGVPASLMEKFTSLTKGYQFIELLPLYNGLQVFNPGEIFRILSSYPSEEIRELVKELNPTERYHFQVYITKKDAPFPEVIRKLEAIRDSLQQTHFAYADVLEILKERQLDAGASYFDMVVATLFERRPEGTYDKESVERFKQRSENYKFVQFRKLLQRDYSRKDELVTALNSYNGPLVLNYPVRDELIQDPYDPSNIYLFHQPVDIELLGNAIKFEFPKPIPWKERVKANSKV